VWLRGEAQLNTFIEPSAGIMASTAGRLQFVGALYYRDVAPNQQSRFLQVSRLPEVGAVWSRSPRARVGRFLSPYVSGVNYPPPLDVSSQWFWAMEATAGYFRQHRGSSDRAVDETSRDGSRFLIQAQAVRPVLALGPIRLNDLRVQARQSVYNSGDLFSVFGTGIGKRWRLGRFSVSVHRFDQFTQGRTPFLFDDVELSQEWRPALSYQSRNFSFSYAARVRGQEGRLYDQVFSISKLFHCIEPRLTYRARRQEIGIEIRIAGLSGFKRSRPDQSRSTEDSLEVPGVRYPQDPRFAPQ